MEDVQDITWTPAGIEQLYRKQVIVLWMLIYCLETVVLRTSLFLNHVSRCMDISSVK